MSTNPRLRPGSCLLTFLLLLTAARPAIARDTEPPTIEHDACKHYEVGEPFMIWARFVDDSKILEPRVFYRKTGQRAWKHAPLDRVRGANCHKVVISTEKLGGVFEYFIEVFDDLGNGPARHGDRRSPVRVRPSNRAVECVQITDQPQPDVPPGLVEPEEAPLEETPTQERPHDETPDEGETGDRRSEVIEAAEGDRPNGTFGPLTPVNVDAGKHADWICSRASRPLYCNRWLWVGIGGTLLVAGGIGIYLAARSEAKVSQDTRSVRLNIESPGPASSAVRGAWGRW